MVEDRYDHLIAALYDAALDPGCWPAAMANFKDVFETGVGGIMFVTDNERRVRMLGSPDRAPSVDDYARNWADPSPPARQDCRRSEARPFDIARAASALREGAICVDDAFSGHDALKRTAFYRDHLCRFDFHHALGAKIWNAPRSNAVLSLSRGANQGRFTADHLKLMARILPHLKRAIAMAERMAWAVVGGTAASRCPMFLIDQTGRCVDMNDAAKALVDADDGIRVARGEVQTQDQAANRSLADAIAAAVLAGDDPRRSGAAVSLPRSSGALPLSALVMPVGRDHDVILPRRPAALVTVIDPATRTAQPVSRLRKLFHLTPSEAAVAAGIAEGRELKAVATGLGFSNDTARQYLTRTYVKTGTRRQSDLSRLLNVIGVHG